MARNDGSGLLILAAILAVGCTGPMALAECSDCQDEDSSLKAKEVRYENSQHAVTLRFERNDASD